MNDILSSINLKHTDRSSINYAKARCAIEAEARAQLEKAQLYSKGNAALAATKQKAAHSFVSSSKKVVITFLKGRVSPCPKLGRKVEFDDGTVAKY